MRLEWTSLWLKCVIAGLCLGFVLKASLLLYEEGFGERLLLLLSGLLTGVSAAALWFSWAARGFVRGVRRISFSEARSRSGSQTGIKVARKNRNQDEFCKRCPEGLRPQKRYD